MGVPTVTVEKDHASPAPYDAFLHGLGRTRLLTDEIPDRLSGINATLYEFRRASPLAELDLIPPYGPYWLRAVRPLDGARRDSSGCADLPAQQFQFAPSPRRKSGKFYNAPG